MMAASSDKRTSRQRSSDTDIQIALIAQDVGYTKEQVKEIKRIIESGYVSKDEFEPIKKIVYGLVSLILLAVVGALMGVVLIER